ncbi:twin-arginine translocase subunit TatC [Commensalibacter melissae]|uniref:twin-arginine translocase subunit TatC n=1 Tax=Commensalibacter melissae TaxID=2070537 RepID=UPI000EFAEF08|nr:twin-arginine translocase subunit TatC [Commensalibacter melissae]AYN87653.1 twin-arginine translocase subunit TatC [Commensalibacter melissae]
MNIPEEEELINDKSMSLMEHFIELRRRMIVCLATFLIAFGFCYYYSEQIYMFLAHPLAQAMRQQGEQPHLIYTALYEAFFTYIKLAFFGAIFCSFPMFAIQAWIYIAPGLYRNEKRIFAPFLVATPILFLLGAALAYFFVFPFAWKFFLSFQVGGDHNMHIELQAKVSEYLSLVMRLIMAFGIAFELPVMLTLMAKIGFVTSLKLKKFRRYAYVIAFVIAAVLTPPDVITQTSLAIPLIILYEISILSARMVEPKPEKELL